MMRSDAFVSASLIVHVMVINWPCENTAPPVGAVTAAVGRAAEVNENEVVPPRGVPGAQASSAPVKVTVYTVFSANGAWETCNVLPVQVGNQLSPPLITKAPSVAAWSMGSLNWIVISCVKGTPLASVVGVCEEIVGAVESISNAGVCAVCLPPFPSMTVTSTRTFVALMLGAVQENVFCPAAPRKGGPAMGTLPAPAV